jgi:transcriptional antiterminator RfaH
MAEEGPPAEIATGPFAEFIARIPHHEDNQRFWLVLDFLGQKTRVQVTHD